MLKYFIWDFAFVVLWETLYKFYFLWCIFRFFIKINWFYKRSWGKSLVAQTVTNLPVMQETRVQSRGWEDPLEKGMAIHSSILTREILCTEEPGRLQSMRSQRVRHNGLWESLLYNVYNFCSKCLYPNIL